MAWRIVMEAKMAAHKDIVTVKANVMGSQLYEFSFFWVSSRIVIRARSRQSVELATSVQFPSIDAMGSELTDSQKKKKKVSRWRSGNRDRMTMLVVK
jgi:hypothetical protein